MTNFSKIKIGTWFSASDGEKYKKTSELTYDDAYGLERYIDPLFDKKIGKAADSTPVVDTSAKVVKGASDETVDTSAKVVKTPKKRASKKKAAAKSE